MGLKKKQNNQNLPNLNNQSRIKYKLDRIKY